MCFLTIHFRSKPLCDCFSMSLKKNLTSIRGLLLLGLRSNANSCILCFSPPPPPPPLFLLLVYFLATTWVLNTSIPHRSGHRLSTMSLHHIIPVFCVLSFKRKDVYLLKKTLTLPLLAVTKTSNYIQRTEAKSTVSAILPPQ